ncbi:MAG: 2-amino-4-hydroxy-6-hydroxymethyldihydropteridine diphosphokinase [Gallionellales bacterium GWA2_55_18]|nr:MAG: 2-amino-4-hydroxy-6-hydroxymethyldihydropteridine diphosphokinase [Gallionellales bacterium GWA2_55_18]
MPHIAFIGLGSNLEDPRSQLQRAFTELDGLPETRLVACSSLYRSAPMGYLDQPEFVNAVAKIETTLPPQALLQGLLNIEYRHGRERTFRNAPRTLDLDILLYGDTQLHEHGLTIPHPQMHLRPFVLQPLLEIAPDAAIPGIGRVVMALDKCRNQVLEMLADAA